MAADAAKKPPALPTVGTASVAEWGVVGDSTTDDTANLTAACAAAAANPGLELIIPMLCRITAPLVISGGVQIRGPGGVIADPGVPVAMSLGGASDFKRSHLRGLVVTRSGGAPPAGSVGLLVTGGANIVVEDPIVYQHDIGIRFSGTNAPGTGGFIGHLVRGEIGAFASYAVEVDGWPALRMAGTWFGTGGSLQGLVWDYDAKAVIHVTGGEPTAGGGGPNTIVCEGCNAVAFNRADGVQAAWDALWNFSGLSTAGEPGEEGIYHWTGGHCEEMRALARADATAQVIDDFLFANSSWVGCYGDAGKGIPWFGPGFAAGELRRWRLMNVNVYSWGETAAPLIVLDGPLLTDFVVDTVSTYQNVPPGSPAAQGSPSSISIVAPAGSYGRVTNTDVLAAAISISGDGAAGFVR